MKTVLLVCGGKSHEHEISLRSAKNIYKSLITTGYTVVVAGLTQKNMWLCIDSSCLEHKEIKQGMGKPMSLNFGSQSIAIDGEEHHIDVIFPINHGAGGEDGCIQGVASMLGVSCVGPGVQSSVLCYHKHLTKSILQSYDVKCAPGVVVYQGNPIPKYSNVAKSLGDVVFVKPSAAGSSVGVSKVESEDQYIKAISDAFEVDDVVLIEQGIVGREIEFAVLGSGNDAIVSLPGEIQTDRWYSYQEKYDNSSQSVIKVVDDISHQQLTTLQSLVSKIYTILGCTGLARVDGFYTKSGEFILNEVNTLPGFTSISMYPQLMQASGIDTIQLMKVLIDSAV